MTRNLSLNLYLFHLFFALLLRKVEINIKIGEMTQKIKFSIKLCNLGGTTCLT